jgi:hypothetical protein
LKLNEPDPKLEGVDGGGCEAGWKVNGFFTGVVVEPELKLMPDC